MAFYQVDPKVTPQEVDMDGEVVKKLADTKGRTALALKACR